MDNKNDNTNVKDWPIEPTFLSIRDGVNKYDKESSYSPNKDGLFDANELRGILANASASKDASPGGGKIFALFQVVPDKFEYEGLELFKEDSPQWFIDFQNTDSNTIRNILKLDNKDKDEDEKKKILRIYPGALYPNLPFCESFRECKYKDKDKNDRPCSDKCFEMDSRIALLYHPDLPTLKRKEEKYDWTDFTKKLNEIINDYNNEIFDNSFRLEIKKTTRPCVGYRCLYSGLMEYFAPIIHAGKVVAVLMHGQCAPEGLKPKDMFKGYYKGKCWPMFLNSKSPEKKLSKSINKTYRDDVKLVLGRNFFNLNQEDYEKREKKGLQIILKKIVELEEKIDEVVKARSRDFVSQKFFELEREFRDNGKTGSCRVVMSANLAEKIEESNKSINNYEDLLNRTLNEILAQFNLDDPKKNFIRIYAIESSIANRKNPNKNAFNIIGDSSYKAPDDREYKEPIFNYIEKRDKPLKNKELLDTIPVGEKEPIFPKRYWEKLSGFDPETDYICVEFAFPYQIGYLIWERYDEKLDKESDQFKEYKKYLNLMNHTLLEPYIILEMMKSRAGHENTMRITSHESAQPILTVLSAINNRETEAALEEGTILKKEEMMTIPKYKIVELSYRLSLLNNVAKRLSNIFKQEEPDIEPFDFCRIIRGTELLFREEAYLNNRQHIIVSFPEELKRYDLNTNQDYLGHILFNLIDNAVKYGFRGSNINLRVWLDPLNPRIMIDAKTIFISVISYGAKIEEKDKARIFELYYRSDQAKDKPGMGIGGFLVEKLCHLLGYNIECNSGKVADYHLPVRFHYAEQNGKWGYDGIDRKLLNDIVNQAIPKRDWEIYPNVYEKLRSQPTYKNEFIIKIPVKVKKIENGIEHEVEMLKIKTTKKI